MEQAPVIRCSRCAEMAQPPQGDITDRLFHDVHEGAWLMRCSHCPQWYLGYFVEHRDDMLQYLCPVSNDEALQLRNDPGQAQRVRALIGGRRVYFKTPWSSEWADGARVLQGARPW